MIGNKILVVSLVLFVGTFHPVLTHSRSFNENVRYSHLNGAEFVIDAFYWRNKAMSTNSISARRTLDGLFSRLEKTEKKRLQIILEESEYSRLERLQKKVSPSTKAEATSIALQLFEGIIDLCEEGGKIYFSESGDIKDAREVNLIG